MTSVIVKFKYEMSFFNVSVDCDQRMAPKEWIVLEKLLW